MTKDFTNEVNSNIKKKKKKKKNLLCSVPSGAHDNTAHLQQKETWSENVPFFLISRKLRHGLMAQEI